MKNFVLAIFVMCVLPIALSSCSDDEKSLEPLTADSIKGEYVGALTINGDMPISESQAAGRTFPRMRGPAATVPQDAQ